MQNMQTTLPVGTILQGRYLVQGLLGSSPFGAVYLVKDEYVKPDFVNLLVLKEVVNPSKHKLHQIVLEAMTLRLLHHQALPHVYQVITGVNHDRVYLLMDHIEGPDLECLRVQQSEQRFSFPQAMTLMAPIMEAVAYLHRQQPPIIHQNIKLGNILVPTTSDKAVLVNFGVDKRYNLMATTKTAPGQLMAGYEAPEQGSQAAITQSDIYALGATFYTLLTGVVPLNASSRSTQMESIGKDSLETINQVRPPIPSYVAKSIHRALSLSSEDRFANVEQFAQALRFDSTWKLPPVEKREFDLALKAAFREHHIPEPSLASSLSMPPKQEEGKPPAEPGAEAEEIKLPFASIVKQDEVRPLPVSVTKSAGIKPTLEPIELQSGANPAASNILPEAMAKQLEGEHLTAAELIVGQKEPEFAPETLATQVQERLVPVTEPVEKEEESRLAPEQITSKSATSPAASSSKHEPGTDQVEGELMSAAEPVVREEASRHIPESSTVEPVENPATNRQEPGAGPQAVQEEVLLPSEPQLLQEDPRSVSPLRSRPLHPTSFLHRGRLVPVFLLLVVSISLGTVLLVSALRPLAAGLVSSTPSLVQKATPSFPPSTTGSSRPTPSPAFHLAHSYEGTIFNLTSNVRSNIFLRRIQQQQNALSGYFSGLSMNAPFQGSLDASRHIQFKVISPTGSAMFSFDGSMQEGGTFGGSYCHLDQHDQCFGEYGLWSLSPVS